MIPSYSNIDGASMQTVQLQGVGILPYEGSGFLWVAPAKGPFPGLHGGKTGLVCHGTQPVFGKETE
jgi:hypothetical protein